MNPKRKSPLSRRCAALSGVFALFMWVVASPVLASCFEIGGSDVCVEPKQYEPRYTINAKGIGICPSYQGPAIQPPWLYTYKSKSEAYNEFKKWYFCGRTPSQMNLCSGPDYIERGSGYYSNAVQYAGFEPEKEWWTDGSENLWTAFWFSLASNELPPSTGCGPEFRGEGILAREQPILCPVGTKRTALPTTPPTLVCLKDQSQICAK